MRVEGTLRHVCVSCCEKINAKKFEKIPTADFDDNLFGPANYFLCAGFFYNQIATTSCSKKCLRIRAKAMKGEFSEIKIYVYFCLI